MEHCLLLELTFTGSFIQGIITNSLRDYVLLGDASAMTDNEIGNNDDRWVFTENNPARELTTAANVAAASRALKGFNDTKHSGYRVRQGDL